MNNFELALAAMIGEATLRKLQRVKVGIAGAGGLGSNCARYLVGSGFRRFKIVDFDHVESSNLNRQFYFNNQIGQLKVNALVENLKQINPDLEINAMALKIDRNNAGTLFADCDGVVEALDGAEHKKMIVEAYIDSAKIIVAASGLAGWGDTDKIITRQFGKNFYVVGDFVSQVSKDCPPMAPAVNIAAAKQADIILNYFLSS